VLITYSTLSQKYPFTLLLYLFLAYTVTAVTVGYCYLRDQWRIRSSEAIASFRWGLGITISYIILALASLSLAIVDLVQFPHSLPDPWRLVSALHLVADIILQQLPKPM
jgi:hypothetical protein